jgi:hypothetical protein
MDLDVGLEDAMRDANVKLQRLPVAVRAAAYRFSAGELEVAVVVAGDEGLYESLARLGSPSQVRGVLDDCFGFVGVHVAAAYNNDRTWAARLAEERDWLGVRQAPPTPPGLVRTARPDNPQDYGAAAELPPAGQLYVACQARMYGADAVSAAVNFRKWIAETRWVNHTYQVVNSRGQAFWWNSGGWSEEWHLTRPDGEGYIVTWDVTIEAVPDDANATMQVVGAQLQRAAQEGPFEVLVIAPHGARSSVAPNFPA